MRREDPGCVGQGEQPLVERVVELAGEFVGGDTDRREQVGTADVADEHGVAGEHGVRRLVVGVLVDHDRDRFGRVARGVTDLEGDVAEAVSLAVGKAPGFELGDGDIAIPDLRPGGGSQFEVAREKVGVEVRLEHQLDREPVLLGRLEIRRHVATGVDDDGTLRALVGDDIGGLREAVEVVLFEEHPVRPFTVSFPMSNGSRGRLTATSQVQ